ncbi:PREDICTED: eukaryotic translation initiation factor 5B-like isoform X3 [Populus euphratica]|uniref:Eukaryotic translation initiation factor 5B-like isoform X3 n=1 Tax=Populus euphratica TaxID=75702 RepID=A0AAJ6U2J9_POPEU|nr:PREDICTED: eukaryotic translation initiation factor 5B-like isoform X3 [Populus euphratica]
MGSLKEIVDKTQKKKKNKKANDSDFSEKDVMIKTEDGDSKVNKSAKKKKRKRKREKGNNADGEDDETKAEGEKKRNTLRKKKKRIGKPNNAVVGKFDQLGAESEDGFNELKGKSEKSKKKKREHDTSKEDENMLEKRGETNQDEACCISSGDEDYSKGMKKWLTEYHQSRPGLTVLQQRLDEFIIAHEEKLEQERKEREAQAAEGGWTVVKHHKGRKKTTDSESGITVGSVAPAAVENQMTKKKPKEVGLEFYRFQKREAQRSEIMALRSKFEEDRKRIQQLRAARKFRPY